MTLDIYSVIVLSLSQAEVQISMELGEACVLTVFFFFSRISNKAIIKLNINI